MGSEEVERSQQGPKASHAAKRNDCPSHPGTLLAEDEEILLDLMQEGLWVHQAKRIAPVVVLVDGHRGTRQLGRRKNMASSTSSALERRQRYVS